MFQLKRSFRNLLRGSAAFALIISVTGNARANLALTTTGIDDGFSLATSSSGYADSKGNGTGVGPIGVGFTSGGGTVVSDYPASALVFYPTDANNQTVAANGKVVSGYPTVTGIVTTGGNIYVANQGAGSIIKLNGDGSYNSTRGSGLSGATGMVVNPATGHIYVSNLTGTVFNVNPATGATTPFITGVAADGVSISPDGSILYAEVNQHILGYSTATGAQVWDSGLVKLADGAVAASGALAGNLFVNTNDGNVYEINEKTLAQTLIATGGSRGDLVTVDPNDGSLLLSQSNSIDRLTLPDGSTFASNAIPSSSVAAPEPASFGVLSLGMAAVGMIRRRKR